MKKNNKGFTLAELLIVVAVIAVLVAVAIPTFTNQLEKSRQAVDISNLREAYAAARLAEQSQMIGEDNMTKRGAATKDDAGKTETPTGETESVTYASFFTYKKDGDKVTIKTGYDPKTGDLTLDKIGEKQMKAKGSKVVADTSKLSARVQYGDDGALTPASKNKIVVTFESTDSGKTFTLSSVTFAADANQDA